MLVVTLIVTVCYTAILLARVSAKPGTRTAASANGMPPKKKCADPRVNVHISDSTSAPPKPTTAQAPNTAPTHTKRTTAQCYDRMLEVTLIVNARNYEFCCQLILQKWYKSSPVQSRVARCLEPPRKRRKLSRMRPVFLIWVKFSSV